jgi:membrane protease YdiL (CAAX protease family)
MEQPLNPVSPPPQSFESRLSRVKAWTLVPAHFGPLLVGSFIGGVLGVPAHVSRQATEVLLYATLLVWWLVLAAPRPYSVRATMGRPLNLAGWGQVLVAFLGVYCLSWIDMLAGHGRELLRAASSGGTFAVKLAGPDPADLVALLVAVALAPVSEELVFRATLFRAWRARWNPVLALLVSSVLFGALHPLKVHSFLAAVTFALLYTRNRSLWANVLAHSLTNASLYVVGGLHYIWASPQLVLNGPVA